MMKYFFLLVGIFIACRNNTGDELLKTKLNQAILQKDADALTYERFKMENAP
jgi:hypothetical protein